MTNKPQICYLHISSSEKRWLSMKSQDFATGGSITVIDYKIIPKCFLYIQNDFKKILIKNSNIDPELHLHTNTNSRLKIYYQRKSKF